MSSSSRSTSPPNVPASLSAPDAGVDALAASAGSTAAVSRGHAVAAATMAVVMLGALGVAFRPVLIRSFAGNAAIQTAAAGEIRAARSAAARASPAVQAKLARLAELERAHRARHPLLFALAEGGPEAEMALRAAAMEEEGDGGPLGPSAGVSVRSSGEVVGQGRY